MTTQSKTPRTDAFIAQLEAVRIPGDLDPVTMTALALALRELMNAWAGFARELEGDLNHSTPLEWKDEARPHR